MTAETGIKIGNMFIAYKLDCRDLINEIMSRLKDCNKDGDKFKRFENDIICRQFLEEDIVWDMELNEGEERTNIRYFELDFEKKKIFYRTIDIWAYDFNFDDEVLVCYDEIQIEPIFIVVGEIVVEQDNFTVVRCKYDKLYYLLKDKTYIVDHSKDKDVLTKAVLDKLKNGY